MSLHIDTRSIIAVLIGAKWKNVRPGTFHIDQYEYSNVPAAHYAQNPDSGYLYNFGLGFQFIDADEEETTLVSGPITSIMSVVRTPPIAPPPTPANPPQHQPASA